MEEGLQQIKCPVLILLGEKDDLFIDPARIMAKHIPSCRHVVLEGVGHMTAIEAPDRLGDALMEFMAENPM